jgi:excisionase family DNA binding protein
VSTVATPPSEMLTSKEVAAYLSCSVRTIWRLAEAGRLTPIRLSRKFVRFHREELEKLAEVAPVSRVLAKAATFTPRAAE